MRSVILIASVALLASCSSPSEKVDKAKQAYKTEKYERAFELYLAAVEPSFISQKMISLGMIDNSSFEPEEAEYWLGVMYDGGQGVSENAKQAVYWYSRAAARGDARAQVSLGSMFAAGRGVKIDMERATFWWREAAQQGHPWGQYGVGVSYARGDGLPQDYKKSVKWITKAAEQGYFEAQYQLGLLYRDGGIVEKDKKIAFDWFMKAARQKHKPSQIILGSAYLTGAGVEKDEVAACKWYALASHTFGLRLLRSKLTEMEALQCKEEAFSLLFEMNSRM